MYAIRRGEEVLLTLMPVLALHSDGLALGFFCISPKSSLEAGTYVLAVFVYEGIPGLAVLPRPKSGLLFTTFCGNFGGRRYSYFQISKSIRRQKFPISKK